MFVRTCRFLKGSCKVSARGFAAERFINLAVRNGIKLWDVKRKKEFFVFSCAAADLDRLYLFAQKTGTELVKTKVWGLPTLAHKYRHRYGFMAGLIVFAALLIYMSSFVWLIEITGNEQVSDYDIMTVLNKNGLYTGVCKYTIDTLELERKLKNSIDDINYVHIKIDGTRAAVNVAEQAEDSKTDMLYTPCDVISDSTAVVTDIVAATGKPLVHPGDAVKNGDVLISGDITYMLDGEEKLFASVPASGEVRGRVTRRFASRVPLTVKTRQYTTNKRVLYSLKIFNAIFNTNFIKNDVSFQKYDIIKEITQLGLGKRFMLPIFLEKLTYREYTDTFVHITAADAERLALARLNADIMESYSTDSDIINKSVSVDRDKGAVTASATVTAVERLGITSVRKDTQGGNAFNGTTEDTDNE